jgi:hypothetical protein
MHLFCISKITNKVMSAKYRARSTDKWGQNQRGPSIYPMKQTVCQSMNYWRLRHRCDTRHNTHDEDVVDDMEKNIEEETRELMKTLQKECQQPSQKDHDANEALQSYLHHTFMSISKINNNKNNNNANVSTKKIVTTSLPINYQHQYGN